MCCLFFKAMALNRKWNENDEHTIQTIWTKPAKPIHTEKTEKGIKTEM